MAINLEKVLKQVHKEKHVLKSIWGWQRARFKNNFTRKIDKPKLVQWINEQLQKHSVEELRFILHLKILYVFIFCLNSGIP